MNYSLFGITIVALFFQNATGPDYPGWIAPCLAVAATVATVWGQIKQKRLETEIASAHQKGDSQKEVMRAMQDMRTSDRDEMRDIRRRLRMSEAHTKICERGQLKLIAQLIKAGVDVNLDQILDELNTAEKMFLAVEDSENKKGEIPPIVAAAAED